MKNRLFIQIVAVIVVAIILSSLFYFLICTGLRQSNQNANKQDALGEIGRQSSVEDIGRMNYMFYDTTYYSTLFFGASTIKFEVNNVLFDSIAKTRSLNASIEGGKITELTVLLKKYVKSHGAPKTLIITLDENTIVRDSTDVWLYPKYYPYVYDPDFKVLLDKEPKLVLGKYFPPYALTVMSSSIKANGIKSFFFPAKTPQVWRQGYSPVVTNLHGVMKLEETILREDSLGWKMFSDFLTFLGEKKVHVYIIIPPKLKSKNCSASTLALISKIKSFENKYALNIYDYSADPINDSTELFFDYRHLNAVGADIFTKKLAERFVSERAGGTDLTIQSAQ